MGSDMRLLVVCRGIHVCLGGTMSAKGVLIPEEIPLFVRKQ